MRAAWLFPLIIVAASGLPACDGGKPATEPGTPAASVAPSASGQPPASPAAAAARDFSAIQACAVVTPEEVAQVTGGTLIAPPDASGPTCTYVIQVPGGATESYTLFFEPAAAVEGLLGVMSPTERGEAMAGPWDEGWLAPQAMGKGSRLMVLVRGDFAVEVSGPARRDPLLEIAARAVKRTR
jgi:hypothetical protein